MSNEESVDTSAKEEVVESKPAVEKEEYVAKKAFVEVSNDMHRYKEDRKKERARANELEARLKSIEEEKLKEKEEWQTLYEKEKQQREHLEQETAKQRHDMQNARKRAALKNELGNVKDAYLVHADLDSIEISDDNALNSESVLEIANKFRSDYPELIPSTDQGNITNQAAKPGVVTPSSPKSLAEMTTEEKIAELARLKGI